MQSRNLERHFAAGGTQRTANELCPTSFYAIKIVDCDGSIVAGIIECYYCFSIIIKEHGIHKGINKLPLAVSVTQVLFS